MSHPIQITIFIGSCVIQNPANNPIEKKKKAIAQTRFIESEPQRPQQADDRKGTGEKQRKPQESGRRTGNLRQNSVQKD